MSSILEVADDMTSSLGLSLPDDVKFTSVNLILVKESNTSGFTQGDLTSNTQVFTYTVLNYTID